MKNKNRLPLFEELSNAPTLIDVVNEIDEWMLDGSDTFDNKWSQLYDSVAEEIAISIEGEVEDDEHENYDAFLDNTLKHRVFHYDYMLHDKEDSYYENELKKRKSQEAIRLNAGKNDIAVVFAKYMMWAFQPHHISQELNGYLN